MHGECEERNCTYSGRFRCEGCLRRLCVSHLRTVWEKPHFQHNPENFEHYVCVVCKDLWVKYGRQMIDENNHLYNKKYFD